MSAQKIANILLDVSGIGLGVFLVTLGIWALRKGFDGPFIWYVVIVFGVSAFLIHLFRYLEIDVRRWLGLKK